MLAERAAGAAEDAEDAARPQASASEAYRDRPSLRATVDTRLLGKPEKFMGEDSKWKDWEFVTRAYLVAAIEGIEAYSRDADLSTRSECALEP